MHKSHIFLYLQEYGTKTSKYLLDLNWYQDSYLSDLSVNDIGTLIKILVIAENEGLYGSGSTSGIWRMVEELRHRKFEDSDVFEEWAFQNAKNNYVPFGTVNQFRRRARSVKDYHRLCSERSKQVRCQEELRRQKKEIRVKNKAVKYERQKADQLKVSNERKFVIERMNNIDAIQRLVEIANDNDHPPYFYPEEYADISKDQLKKLPVSTKMLILEKLSKPPKGKWKKLVRKLT